jgi:DNA polymerase V
MMTAKNTEKTSALEFFGVDTASVLPLPLFQSKVSAGFPSPAEDYVEKKLDLNKYLIRHPAATFYVKVKGSSMVDARLKDGDILIVDKSLEPRSNDIAVCFLDGEFTVKRIKKTKEGFFLVPENPDYKPIKVTEDNDFQVWGVVTYIIYKP